MHTLNKWVRQLHRWLAMPLVLSASVLIIGPLITGSEASEAPAWLNLTAALSLLSLVLTGVYMFVQHYWAKWRRAK